jgi:hypothetical protein
MRITEFSLRQPMVVLAIGLSVVIFGLFAYFSMGVAISPNVNFPSVVVTTVYPGADRSAAPPLPASSEPDGPTGTVQNGRLGPETTEAHSRPTVGVGSRGERRPLPPWA